MEFKAKCPKCHEYSIVAIETLTPNSRIEECGNCDYRNPPRENTK